MTAPAAPDGVATRSVLGRALAVLDTFSHERPEQTLGAIGEAAGLPSATTHRLVGELVAWGALERVGRGRYRIGLRLWQLSSLAPEPRTLRDVALAFLHDLLEVTHEVVHLAVLDGDRVLYLERLMARPEVHVRSRVARRLPLHATGPGKVLLAHAPDDVRSWVLSHLTRLTPYTVVQPGRLRAQLERARRDGFALTVEEMTLGACSVAVPVRVRGDVVASVGVVVPDLRRDRARLVAALEVAARGIGRETTPSSFPLDGKA